MLTVPLPSVCSPITTARPWSRSAAAITSAPEAEPPLTSSTTRRSSPAPPLSAEKSRVEPSRSTCVKTRPPSMNSPVVSTVAVSSPPGLPRRSMITVSSPAASTACSSGTSSSRVREVYWVMRM